MVEVLFVNPYLFPTDLRGEGEWGSNYAINFGILSIATYLKNQNIDVKIYDAQEGIQSINKIVSIVEKEQPLIVGMGCISSLSFLPSIEIAKAVKQANPTSFIIIGGQHTCFFSKEILNKYICIDAVALNESEETMVQLLNALKNKKKLSTVGGIAFRANNKIVHTNLNNPINLNDLPDIDYSIYPNFKNFFPLIEESRGCGFRCVFCTNENFYGSIRFKSGEKVFSEIEKTSKLYGNNNLPLIIQCSNYGYNLKESEKLFGLIKKSGLNPRIMLSSRVDGPWKKFLGWTKNYLDQMRFGLESGSPNTLLRMNKTSNPSEYLRFAKEAFRSFSDEGITTVANVLYGFCGDTKGDLEETKSFLRENKKNINCVRVHPLMDFPGSPYSQKFDFYEKEYGASRVIAKYSEILQTYPVNPSKNLTYENMLAESHKLMQELNTFDSYYEYYKWSSPAKHKNKQFDFYSKKTLYEDITKTTLPSSRDFHI